MVSSRLYILSGPSGCGKTTLLNDLLNDKKLNILPVQKYGTRRRRESNDGVQDDVNQVFDSPIPSILLVKEIDKVIHKVSKDEIHEYDINLKSLKKYYKFTGEEYLLKKDLQKEDKKALSYLLEDLNIRLPVISVRKKEYWDEYGDKIDFLGASSIDIAYALNNGQYGISTESIYENLNKGSSSIIILSDFRIIRKLKDILKDKLCVIYIASAVDPEKLEKIQEQRDRKYTLDNIDNNAKNEFKKNIKKLKANVNLDKWERTIDELHTLNQQWSSLKSDNTGTKFRTERIKAFHIRYIDNSTLFNYVILNYREGKPEDMTKQFMNIYANKMASDNKHSSPLIVVAAASNAGKGTMMEMLNLIGSNNIQILSKIAKREQKSNDKNDGMLAIGKPGGDTPPFWPDWPKWWSDEMIKSAKVGDFPNEYDFSWSFHGKRVSYAVSDKEIKHNFKNNKTQIVISNIGQFKEFKERYGDRVVFVLLYRLLSMEDTKYYFINEVGLSEEDAHSRATEIDKVLTDYINNIHLFSNVILNTSYPEDMFDQVFQLEKYYHKI